MDPRSFCEFDSLPRSAGVLLHPTSLPGGNYAVGDLGASAHTFADLLAHLKVRVWQVLPLVPTDDGGSPYASWSAMAGNPLLVNLDGLVELGLLEASELPPAVPVAARCDFAQARALKTPLLDLAAERLWSRSEGDALREEAKAWCRHEAAWLDETALFATLSAQHAHAGWWEWPAPLRDREAGALDDAQARLAAPVAAFKGVQFLLDRQWQALRRTCAARGIRLLGDMPFYVDRNSADVWAHRELFELDPGGTPLGVAGVPPDYFSELGQLWGNPLYRWERMAAEGYAWWCARLRRALSQTDLVRIDHFRAFANYWRVPNGAPDARSGAWQPGPGLAFFDAVRRDMGALPLVAEDLGIIDDPVRELLKASGLPGMAVLQFAFGGDASNPFLPHNHDARRLVYTGTHDNDTTLGWWQSTEEGVRDHVRRYFAVNGEDIVWDFIRAALRSPARLAVVPMQDLLTLDSSARMNTPGETDGNWAWRLQNSEVQSLRAGFFRDLCYLYGRVN